MKNFIKILVLIFCLAGANETFSQNVNPTTLSKARVILKEQVIELNKAKEEAQKTKEALEQAELKIKEGEQRTLEVQKLSDENHQKLIKKTNEANTWFTKYEKAVERYHFLKNIAAGVTAVLGAFLGFYVMRFVPTLSPAMSAYAIALPVIGGGLGWALVWLLL